MTDWKEMYLKMFRASEKAIRTLEAAQRECEEIHMRGGDGGDGLEPEEAPDAESPRE